MFSSQYTRRRYSATNCHFDSWVWRRSLITKKIRLHHENVLEKLKINCFRIHIKKRLGHVLTAEYPDGFHMKNNQFMSLNGSSVIICSSLYTGIWRAFTTKYYLRVRGIQRYSWMFQHAIMHAYCCRQYHTYQFFKVRRCVMQWL